MTFFEICAFLIYTTTFIYALTNCGGKKKDPVANSKKASTSGTGSQVGSTPAAPASAGAPAAPAAAKEADKKAPAAAAPAASAAAPASGAAAAGGGGGGGGEGDGNYEDIQVNPDAKSPPKA